MRFFQLVTFCFNQSLPEYLAVIMMLAPFMALWFENSQDLAACSETNGHLVFATL